MLPEVKKEFGVTNYLEGFYVPEMHHFDKELRAIKMDIMHDKPFIIDFAKTRHSPPDFSAETRRYFEQELDERFGENAIKVRRLLKALESFQLYYVDPSPYNIVF